jgi:TolB protein
MRIMIMMLGLLFVASPMHAETVSCAIEHAQRHEKTDILLVMVGSESEQAQEIAKLVKKALEFNGQCTLAVQLREHMLNKQEALVQAESGYSYIILVDNTHNNALHWHLFDALENNIVKSKKVAKKGNVLRSWAYALADSVYQVLTNKPGFFSTKIAYTKEIPLKNGLHYAHICIADYDGSNEQVLVQTPTINVAPRWNRDANRPLIFYSENTNTNMRMMVTDMHKKHIIASNFDGLNMLPAFSDDGMCVAYCATRGSGSCDIYQWQRKQLKKITHNNSNNFWPVFGNDGIIYFISDYQTGRPHIFAYNPMTNTSEAITQDGYYASPTFCSSTGCLAYTKNVKGVMQIFGYDTRLGAHTQLTDDKAQKEECVWSACGTLLLCSVNDGKSSRIAFYNTITHNYHFITPEGTKCHYPTWSIIYNEYPVVS